jgi:uncharacterized protein (DUF2267 family)
MRDIMLDDTAQQTNAWHKKLIRENDLGDREQAYSGFRTAANALRGRLAPERAVHFGQSR